MSDQLQIWIDGWVHRHFAPEIESYCNILLNRVIPIFEDFDGEGEKAANEFLGCARAPPDADYHEVLEAAYEHAQEHVMQFMEMRSVFLAAGVSGLFHLFERQLYKHINKELDQWLTSPIADWRTLEDIIPKFDRKYGEDKPCSDLLDAFRDSDLLELRLVANTVKHGDDGQSHKQLVVQKARVVEPERLANDFTVGPYSILKVNISVHVNDVERYRDAILRFWSLKGTFCANRAAFR